MCSPAHHCLCTFPPQTRRVALGPLAVAHGLLCKEVNYFPPKNIDMNSTFLMSIYLPSLVGETLEALLSVIDCFSVLKKLLTPT